MSSHKIEIILFGYKIKQSLPPNPTHQPRIVKELMPYINHDITNEYMALTYLLFKLSKQVFM